VPQAQDREWVKHNADPFCNRQLRAAAIVLVTQTTGMDLREALLADLPRLSREGNYFGRM